MSDLSTLDELPIINPDEFNWPAFTTAPGVEMVCRFDSMSDLLYNLEQRVSEGLNQGLIVTVRHANDFYWLIGTNATPAEAPAIAT